MSEASQRAPVFAADCLLLTASSISVLVVVVVIVERFFFDDIQLDGIEADDFQAYSTLFTINYVTFVRVGIHVDIGIAFRTRSGRHFFYLQ